MGKKGNFGLLRSAENQHLHKIRLNSFCIVCLFHNIYGQTDRSIQYLLTKGFYGSSDFGISFRKGWDGKLRQSILEVKCFQFGILTTVIQKLKI